MSFRFVRPKGVVAATPVALRMYASGTIQRGSVVEFSRINKTCAPAGSGTTITSLLGIALDYVQGASDTQTRVIPVMPGQLWEADCTNTVNTAHLMIRHALTNNATLANTAVDQSIFTGIFMAYAINTIIANTLIGEFIRLPYWDKGAGGAYL